MKFSPWSPLKIIYLLAFIPLVLSAAEVHYVVRDRTINAVDPRLFGSFMERPSWGNETGPEAALIPGTHELRPVVVELLRGMKLSLVRFPGGTDADYLDWRDMISNVPGRNPARPTSTGHEGDPVSNNFGYDEFLQLAEKLGWEPLLVVNFRNGLLRELSREEAARRAAGLVAYCNAPVGARLPPGMPDWPALRARNGHPAPYHVKNWQIGNETWFFSEQVQKIAPKNPDDYYANCLQAYVKAMLAVDPAIEFIADGVKGGQLARARMPGKLRHLAFHSYEPWAIREVLRDGHAVPMEKLSAADVWYAWVATPDFNDRGLAVFKDPLLPIARREHFKIAVTEWNWNGWWDHPDAPPGSRFAKAVGAAGFVHALMRAGDVIDIGCQSMLVGKTWGIRAIEVNALGSAHYSPSGSLMALYGNHHGARLVDLETADAPTYSQPFKMGDIHPNQKVGYLDALATASDKTLYLHVINRHFDQAMTLAVEAVGFQTFDAKATVYSLIGNPAAGDEEKSPARFSRTIQSEVPCSAAKLTVEVPAQSVSCIEIPLVRH